jgi:hypothetical protein
MILFTKPQNLNGAELLDELKAAGIIAQTPMVDGDNFWLDLKKSDEAKAKPIIAAHNGTMIAPELSITQKLASVGVTIPDLKAALGL